MKVIGNTVGMGLPKPDLSQTDPRKGDFVKGKDKITEAVNAALAQAKASGEFDGADGKDGKDGQDGYTPQKGVDYFDGENGSDGKDGKTPVKGTDYFTAADKQEMAEQAAQMVDIPEGVLVVNITDDMSSHSPAEVWAHLDSGGSVYCLDGAEVYHPLIVTGTICKFERTDITDGILCQTLLSFGSNKQVKYTEQYLHDVIYAELTAEQKDMAKRNIGIDLTSYYTKEEIDTLVENFEPSAFIVTTDGTIADKTNAEMWEAYQNARPTYLLLMADTGAYLAQPVSATATKAVFNSNLGEASVTVTIENGSVSVSVHGYADSEAVNLLTGQVSTLMSSKLDASALPTAINTALAQAKASGEFKGDKGDKGDTGATGPAYTLTSADKTAIVNAVITALPVYNGEVV